MSWKVGLVAAPLLLAACASVRPPLAPEPTRALRKARAHAEVCPAPAAAIETISPGFRYGCFCGLGYPGLSRELGKRPRDMDDKERTALIARYYVVRPIDAVDAACQAHDVCWIWNAGAASPCNEAFRQTLGELRGDFQERPRCRRLAGDMALAAASVFPGRSSAGDRVTSLGVAAVEATLLMAGKVWGHARYPHADERCDPEPPP